MNSKSANWPLILIALAIAGAGISYHFTLQSRFAALEQKLDENSVALQQYQIAQETVVSSKTEALNNLSKEVDTLQASLAPLGKATKEQTDSLAEIRKQVSSLDNLQQAQQDAQKKLADYGGQLEKIKHDVQEHQTQASAPVPPTVPLTPAAPAPAPAVAPATTPTASAVAPTTHASTPIVKSPVPPLTESSAVDLRPAEIMATRFNATRALPVAMPVSPALSDNR